MRSPTAILVCIALLTAGCVSGAGGEDLENASTPGSSPEPDETGEAGDRSRMDRERNRTAEPETNRTAEPEATEFTRYGCRESFVSLEVPASWAEERVPDGFEPIPSGFPPGPRPTAWFVIVTAHCQRTLYGDDTNTSTAVPQTASMFYGVAVDPPDGYENPSAFVHFSLLGWLVDGDTEADRLASWGFPAEAGTLELVTQNPAPGAHAWEVHVESANLTYDLTTRTAGWQDFHDPTVRLFPTGANGSVEHAVDLTPPGHTQYSPAGHLTFDLDGEEAPIPDALPVTQALSGNVKRTPAGESSLHGVLVDLDEA